MYLTRAVFRVIHHYTPEKKTRNVNADLNLYLPFVLERLFNQQLRFIEPRVGICMCLIDLGKLSLKLTITTSLGHHNNSPGKAALSETHQQQPPGTLTNLLSSLRL